MSETIVLKGDLAVPLEALRLLWSLEDRQYRIRVADQRLVVNPRGTLTEEDRTQIAEYKWTLVALVQYCEAHP